MKAMWKAGLLGAVALAFVLVAGFANAAYRYSDSYGNNYARPSESAGTLRCESRNGRTAYCRVDARAGVRLVSQISRSACVRGQTWGVDQEFIWVSRGCRARFEVRAPQYGYGPNVYYDGNNYYEPYNGNAGDVYYDNGNYYYYDNRGDYDNRSYYGSARVLRCESHDGRYNFCGARTGVGRAEIRRQLSDASCRRNQTWGYRSGGVWVDRGCRAEFIVY